MAVAEGREVVDVPHRVLAELADVHAVGETGQVDVVVVGGTHDEEFRPVFSVDANNLDAVDDTLVRLDEPSLYDVLRGVVDPEVEIGEVPHLHAAGSVTRDEIVVIFLGRSD